MSSDYYDQKSSAMTADWQYKLALLRRYVVLTIVIVDVIVFVLVSAMVIVIVCV